MSTRNIMEAINSLQPNAEVHVKSLDDITWVKGDEISKADIETEITRRQAEYDANQYQRDRQYPSIGDQLDMQYHDQIDGTTTWKDAIAKVKADNPKTKGK